MKLSFLPATFLLLISIAGMHTTFAATPSVNQPAPGFALTDSEGKTHSLAEFKGKFVVLEWVNYDCPFVHKQYGSGTMQHLQKTYTERGVTWLSICSSAPGKQGNFAPADLRNRITQERAVPTAYLIDEDGTVGRLYGAKTTPHMFVINPEGRLLYAGAIDDIASTDPDDIPKATNYVRACLDAAIAGKPVVTTSTTSYGCSVKYK
jgi:peroxiredoxin